MKRSLVKREGKGWASSFSFSSKIFECVKMETRSVELFGGGPSRYCVLRCKDVWKSGGLFGKKKRVGIGGRNGR